MRRWRRFRPSKAGNPPLRNQQWGESAGGPIWKDHTFWFENFEKQQFKIATGNQGTEPSAAYQAAALRRYSAYYGVPQNSATTNLLSVLWPSDSLTVPRPAQTTCRPLLKLVIATTA